MRTRISILILFFSISLSSAKYEKQSSFDFSSVDVFFEIEEMLSSGVMPDDALWEDLFQTTGYMVLGGIFTPLIIKEQMLNAFLQPDSTKINSILTTPIEDDLSNQFDVLSQITLKNFIAIKDKKAEINRFRENLDESAIIRDAEVLLRDFLSISDQQKIKSQQVSFAFFEPDSYSKEDGIVIDLFQAYNLGSAGISRLLSHEMYHTYRRKFENQKFTNMSEFAFQIDKLHNEGIADLLSEPDVKLMETMLPPSFVKLYIDAYHNTPLVLQQLDSIVVRYTQGHIYKLEFDRSMADFFIFGGHPNGYYMAQLISKQGFGPQLKQGFHNPISFLQLYNKAASTCNEYVFSEEFLIYLSLLGKKYYRAKKYNN